MPAKRSRVKRNDGSSENRETESQTMNPPKRRKQLKDVDDARVNEDLPKEATDNGKKLKSKRDGKKISGGKKKESLKDSVKSFTVSSEGESIDGKIPKEITKTNKKSRAKPVKSRPANRPRQGVEVVVAETPITHSSHCIVPGNVLVMGQGDCGQLGLGETITERKKPYPVSGDLSGKKVVQVECGGMHTVVLTDDGKVFTWGCNDEGSLGHPVSDTEEYTPKQVTVLDRIKVVQVSAGDCHTVALANNGNVYCWGIFRDSNGPFGMINSSPSLEPQLVYSSSFNRAVKVSSGDNHVMILTEQGDVYTFGSGEQGQLGRVPELFCSRGGRQGPGLFFTPQSIRLSRKRNAKPPIFCDVFAGSFNSFAVAKDRHCVYAWGLNNYGQLGVSDTKPRFNPERVTEDWLWSWQQSGNGDRTLSIAGGMHHSVICDKGTLYTMGRRNYGRLGLGEIEKEPMTPTPLPNVKDVVSVACGGNCSFAVSSTGTAFSWGMGSTLQLGQNDDEDYWEPTVITGKNLEGKKVVGVSSGGQHTALLVTSEKTD